MPGQQRARVGQDLEPRVQPLRHLLQRPQPHPGAREFQGERDAVEPAAHLGGQQHPFGVPERVGCLRHRGHRAGAEQGEGVAVRFLAGQGADLEHHLTGAAERLARGDEHRQAGCGLQQFTDEVAARGDQVLAGVEDQEQFLVGHPRAQFLVHGARGVVREPDGVRHGGGEQAGIAQW